MPTLLGGRSHGGGSLIFIWHPAPAFGGFRQWHGTRVSRKMACSGKSQSTRGWFMASWVGVPSEAWQTKQRRACWYGKVGETQNGLQQVNLSLWRGDTTLEAMYARLTTHSVVVQSSVSMLTKAGKPDSHESPCKYKNRTRVWFRNDRRVFALRRWSYREGLGARLGSLWRQLQHAIARRDGHRCIVGVDWPPSTVLPPPRQTITW